MRQQLSCPFIPEAATRSPTLTFNWQYNTSSCNIPNAEFITRFALRVRRILEQLANLSTDQSTKYPFLGILEADFKGRVRD
jgi:hypothetical protein